MTLLDWAQLGTHPVRIPSVLFESDKVNLLALFDLSRFIAVAVLTGMPETH